MIDFPKLLGKLVKVETNVGDRFTGLLKDHTTKKVFIELKYGNVVQHLKRNIKSILEL
jgi:hypothetical protein